MQLVILSKGRTTDIDVDAGPDATVGDLRRAAGIDGTGLRHRNRLLPDELPLRDSGIAQGDLVVDPVEPEATVQPATERPADVQSDARATVAAVAVVVLTGRSAGRRFELPIGRFVIGRASSARVRLDDQTVSPVHAELSITVDGTITLADIDSENGTTLEESTVTGSPVRVTEHDVIVVGSVLLRIEDVKRQIEITTEAIDDVSDIGSLDGRRILDRSPRVRRTPPLEAIDPPTEPALPGDPPALNIAALVMPLIAGGVLAIVLRNLLFVGFMVLSPLLVVGTWTQGRVRFRRAMDDYRQRVEGWEADVVALLKERQAGERARRRSASPDIASVIRTPVADPDQLWSRRPGHDDFGRVPLGFATLNDRPLRSQDGSEQLRRLGDSHDRLPLVPLPASFDPGAPIGISGDPEEAAACARALVLDVAVHHGPADLAMFVAASGPGAAGRWAWSKWLPHLRNDGSGTRRRLTLSSGTHLSAEIRRVVAAGQHPLVVIDGDDLVSGRRAELRALLDELGDHIRTLVLAPSVDRLPGTCRWIVDLAPGTATAMVTDQRSDRSVMRAHVPLLSADSAERAARSLDRWEDPAETGRGVPHAVSLEDSAMPTAGREGRLECRLGVGADGPVAVDLVVDGPHALVAGMTGAGKSELLRTWIVGLARNYTSEHLAFLLVDYKGGSAFDVCADLPHTVGVVTDLDGDLASRMLVSLQAELRHREEVLRELGVSDLSQTADSDLARLVVVVDEFAALADELPEFLGSLVDIAQRGRSLGVHLILATQRPAGVINDRIRANTAIRVCLGVASTGDSVDVIGVPDAEHFGNTQPGRAIARIGGVLTPVLQTIHSTAPVVDRSSTERVVLNLFTGRSWDDDPNPTIEPVEDAAPTQLERAVDELRQRHTRRGGRTPRRPWLDPLPSRVMLADIERQFGPTHTGAPAVAVVDDPERQAMFTAGWDVAAGNLLITGERGSGRSTALASFVVGLSLAEQTPREIFVVDFTSAGHDDLLSLPQVGAIVRGGDEERLARLLRIVTARIDDRRRCIEGREMVLAVDGWSGWLAELDGPAAQEQFDQLARIVTEGPAFGISVLATDHLATGTTRLRSAFARRILLGRRSARDIDTGADGTTALDAGRGFDDGSGRMIQIAHPGPIESTPTSIGAGGRRVQSTTAPIDVLPALIDQSMLGSSATATSGGGLSVAVGWSGAQLGPAHLTLHPGEHALIAGPPRSGRTGALELLADQVERSGLAEVLWFSSSDSGLASRLRSGEAEGGQLLVLIDDAERTDDDTGILAEILAGVYPAVRLVVAGRADALRRSAGRWTIGLRMCRAGILLNADRDLDGDLVGVRLPRRDIEPPSAGRGHLVSDGEVEVVQIAQRPSTAIDGAA